MKQYLLLFGFMSFFFLRLAAQTGGCPTPSFAPAATYASGGDLPYFVAIDDVNSDGKPDLAVVNINYTFAPGSVGILLNTGGGTFGTATAYSTGGNNSFSVALGDVNGDGKADLAVANTNSRNVGILLNNGDGIFAAAATYPSGGSLPYSVAISDVNGDGKPDVAVANDFSNAVGILLNTGDGTFAAAVTYSSGGTGAFSVTIGDVNGDGKPDLAVANNESTVGILLNKGDGTFAAVATYPSGGSYPNSVALGDVNGDGKPDLAVANNESTVGILLNKGDGTFAAAATYPSGGSYPNSVALGDVNGDGKPDLAVANSESTVGILLNKGDGTFAAATLFPSGGSGSYSVVIGDVNGDGKPDLAVANVNSNTVGILLNTCNPDSDGDGDPDATDCASNNAAIHHGATEIADDGIDQDCDGFDQKTFYHDADNDGYGNPADTVHRNSRPTGYVTNKTDCNDGDNTVYPGAPELCDGKDNDCDGQTDEDKPVVNAGADKTVYNTGTATYSGYPTCAKLTAAASGGKAPYTYKWSTGATGQSISVCPKVTTTYTVTVTDSKGCTAVDAVVVKVIDVRCGNKLEKITVCHKGGNTLCISTSGVNDHLKHGDKLGSCNDQKAKSVASMSSNESLFKLAEEKSLTLTLTVSPNPSSTYFNLKVNSSNLNDKVGIAVIDATGRIIEIKSLSEGQTLRFGDTYLPGIYLVRIMQGKSVKTVKLIKRAE